MKSCSVGTFFFLFFWSSISFSGCAAPLSSIVVTQTIVAPNTEFPLYALSSEAKLGIVSGSTSSAWFSFTEELISLLPDSPVSVEVVITPSQGSSPFTASVGILTDEDFSSNGKLIKNPPSRNLSRVSMISGQTHIRMEGKKPRGFALSLIGSPNDTAQISSVRVEPVITGWKRGSSFFWAGFTDDGGIIDSSQQFPLDSYILPSDANLILSLAASPLLGREEREQVRISIRDSLFSFRLSPFDSSHQIPFTEHASEGITAPSEARLLSGAHAKKITGVQVHWYAKDSETYQRGSRTPLVADPHQILLSSQSAWRNSDFEIYAWDRFPSILIFDTATYAIQNDLFKRLAFFVEKKGFTGRLWSDTDLAGLHAFNAHDYRAESLASFFTLAVAENFPLNESEKLLRAILLSNSIILAQGSSFIPGKGAIISLSKESTISLRYLFMAHEALHGLFFIDEAFRNEVSAIYSETDPNERLFLKEYFSKIDTLAYDINDTYLMENEFMAYLLQQPLNRVQPYFLETLAPRLVRYKGNQEIIDYLYASNASSFLDAATALNEYLYARWGVEGGRVGMYSVRKKQ